MNSQASGAVPEPSFEPATLRPHFAILNRELAWLDNAADRKSVV